MKKIKKIKNFKVKKFTKSSGRLIPVNFDKHFPIKVKRIFFVYGKKNKVRGEHAHKKCSQLFFPIFGKIILTVKTPNSEKKIILDHLSKKAVLVPPKYWCTIKFVKKNSILMVACDQYYKVNDYLQSFNNYTNYLKKK